MTATPGRRTCLYTPAQLDAIVADMARQAAGLLTARTRIAIVGILRRGAPLADRLQAALHDAYGVIASVRLDLQIKRYADDLTLLFPETQLTENPAHAMLDLAGYTVLLVDDVMYRGQEPCGNPHRRSGRPRRRQAAGSHRHCRGAARRRPERRHRVQRPALRRQFPDRPAAALNRPAARGVARRQSGPAALFLETRHTASSNFGRSQ